MKNKKPLKSKKMAILFALLLLITGSFSRSVQAGLVQEGTTNRSPVADNLLITTNEDEAVNIDLNATDPENDPLSFRILTPPSSGTIDGEAPSLIYSPIENFNGSDSFTYVANDGERDSEPALVSITVIPMNDMAYAQNNEVSVQEDGSVEILLKGGDIDGDAVEFYVFEGPQHGTLSGEAPGLTYTPDANFNGQDNFIFAVYDGFPEAASAEGLVTITVLPMNDMPYADNQAVSVEQNGSVAVTLTGGDIDGDELEFYIFEGPQHGTLTGEIPNLMYTPNPDFVGNDSFIFAISDGFPEAASAEGLVSITVLPKNNIPTANSRLIKIVKDSSAVITLTGSDPDHDSLTFRIETPPTNGSLSGSSPDLIYTPASGFTGSDTFTFIAYDGKADSLPATIKIIVASVGRVVIFRINPGNHLGLAK